MSIDQERLNVELIERCEPQYCSKLLTRLIFENMCFEAGVLGTHKCLWQKKSFRHVVSALDRLLRCVSKQYQKPLLELNEPWTDLFGTRMDNFFSFILGKIKCGEQNELYVGLRDGISRAILTFIKQSKEEVCFVLPLWNFAMKVANEAENAVFSLRLQQPYDTLAKAIPYTLLNDNHPPYSCFESGPPNGETQCDICFESFLSPEQVYETTEVSGQSWILLESRFDHELAVQLQCGHVFGKNCFAKTLEAQRDQPKKFLLHCPMCRTVLFKMGSDFGWEIWWEGYRKGLDPRKALELKRWHRTI